MCHLSTGNGVSASTNFKGFFRFFFFLRFSVPVFLRACKSLNLEVFVGKLLCNRHVYRDRDDV